MGKRLWHLEHADGRKWTFGELDALAVRRCGHFDGPALRGVCIDERGEPVVLDTAGTYHYPRDTRLVDDGDMAVVWDE